MNDQFLKEVAWRMRVNYRRAIRDCARQIWLSTPTGQREMQEASREQELARLKHRAELIDRANRFGMLEENL